MDEQIVKIDESNFKIIRTEEIHNFYNIKSIQENIEVIVNKIKQLEEDLLKQQQLYKMAQDLGMQG